MPVNILGKRTWLPIPRARVVVTARSPEWSFRWVKTAMLLMRPGRPPISLLSYRTKSVHLSLPIDLSFISYLCPSQTSQCLTLCRLNAVAANMQFVAAFAAGWGVVPPNARGIFTLYNQLLKPTFAFHITCGYSIAYLTSEFPVLAPGDACQNPLRRKLQL
jgi:hypothetical protein